MLDPIEEGAVVEQFGVATAQVQDGRAGHRVLAPSAVTAVADTDLGTVAVAGASPTE